MRARGPLPVPDDVAIVAIDEASLARLGRYHWRRSLMAEVFDQLAAARREAPRSRNDFEMIIRSPHKERG